MKNNIIRFILSMALAFVAVPMVAQDFLTVFLKDGIQRKFYLEGVTEIATSQYDAEGVQHTEYAYQHIVTRNKTYIYVLEDIDSITFTKYCEEEVKQAFSSALSVAFPSLSPCETIEDAEQKIDIIKNADGVEDAWREGDDIYIKIENWETISFHFHPYNKEQDNKELIRSLESLKRVIPQLRSGGGQGRMPSVVVANQQHYDTHRSDQKELLETLCKQLRDFGFDAHYEKDPKIEFFDTGMYQYDIVVLMTHGNYSNGQHSFVTVEELGDKSFKINIFDNTPAEDADYNKPSEEVKEAWRKAFNDLVNKKKYQGSSTVTLNYNKEFRGSFRPHWIAHPQINEDFFEKKENGGLSEGKFRPNSIFFNGACHSMNGKDDAWHSLADKLIDNHGLSLYFGYENENYNSHETACIFLRSMFNGLSTKNAFYSIPDYYRVEPEGAVLKFWPEIGTADIFLFQTHTNQVDQTKAKNDFKNSKYVEVEGLATILDRDKSETLNAITYGFVYGTDERIASDEHITSKLTYGTYISSTDKKALSSTIDKGNVLFKARLTKIDPEKTYYYRAYTYDGIYYNYGNPCSFIINPPIRLNDGESFIVDDVAYTVRSKEERTCQVGYVTNTVKPSARKRVGSNIVPAILPDREGELSIPEEAGYLSVIAVGDYSFYDCGKVIAINLPETIEEIGESAMSGCVGLSSITIPKNVKKIDRNAFGGCKNVKSIYAEMTTPFSIAENVFQTASEEQAGTASTIFANATLYVPVGSKNQYATTPGWNKFQRIDEYTPGGDNPDPDNPNPNNPDDSIINFADPAVANICIERWDTNGDGKLSMEEAAAVTDLGDKFYYFITSFDELQYFTGLTSIGSYVFSDCSKLASVTLPNTITTIGHSAFAGCTNLTSIVIPNSVTTIENCAFMYCTGLTNVTIPNSVTTIMDQAFEGCSSLVSLTIPNSATDIGGGAFMGCSGLTSVTFHCSIIKDWFIGNESIHEIVIGDEVTTIENFAFQGCTGLVSVTIPHSVMNIGEFAFSGCGLVSVTFHCSEVKQWYYGGSLREVIIGDDVSSISDYAFYDCTSLESVVIGNSVTSIGKGAFYGCTNLSSLTIGNSVKSIGESAFYDCKSITSVTIPNSIENIGWLAFYGCSSLTSVTYHCKEIKYWFGENNIKEVFIGDEVTSIGEHAFSGFTGLTSVTIPNSVKSIGESAFHGCTNLTTVSISNSVTVIKRETFYGCENLTSVTIPNSVTDIEYCAFYGCNNLTSVIIGNSVTSIISAFGGCSSLTSMTFHCNEIKRWFNSNGTIKEIIIGDEVTSIGEGAFENFTCLSSVTIGKSVTSIGAYAFSNCALTSVTFNCSSIHRWFDFHNDIEKVVFGEGVKSIGEEAIYGFTKLTTVTIPNSVTSIGEFAFSRCNKLSSITSKILEPFAIDNNTFSVYNSAILYVPAGTKAKYETTDGWKNFKNIVEMGGDDDPVSQQEIDKLNAELDNLIPQIRDAWSKLYNKTFGEEERFAADIYGKLSEFSTRMQQCRTMLSVVETQKEIESLKAEVASIAELLSTAAQQTEAFSLSFGDTFVATSAEGIELKFTVLNAQEKTCLVGDMSQQHSHSALTNFDQTGSVTVPATVNYNGETYKVTEIGPGAFSSCRLSFINIPSVSHIWMNAFWFSQITEITIPESVTGMGPQIFSRCSQLKKVICLIKEPIVLNQRSLFDGIPADATLYVPAGTKARYEATEGWKNFKNIVEME